MGKSCIIKGIGGGPAKKIKILFILIYVAALSFSFLKWGHMSLDYRNFLFYKQLCEGGIGISATKVGILKIPKINFGSLNFLRLTTRILTSNWLYRIEWITLGLVQFCSEDKILLKIVNLNKFNEPKLTLEISEMSTLVADIYERVHCL